MQCALDQRDDGVRVPGSNTAGAGRRPINTSGPIESSRRAPRLRAVIPSFPISVVTGRTGISTPAETLVAIAGTRWAKRRWPPNPSGVGHVWRGARHLGGQSPHGDNCIAGVTVGLIHTGSSYADDLSADGVIYHYPKTQRPASRDLSEIDSTKAAGDLRLPVFVITHSTAKSSTRDVHLGWVEGWDDSSRLFLVSFRSEPPETLLTADESDQTEFTPTEDSPGKKTTVFSRPDQRRFKFRVFQRYGARCAVCDVSIAELLDAVHLLPKRRNGTDDPRNGLVLCPLHHRAFDGGLFGIEAETLTIVYQQNGPSADELLISRKTLDHLRRKPHQIALTGAWREYWHG